MSANFVKTGDILRIALAKRKGQGNSTEVVVLSGVCTKLRKRLSAGLISLFIKNKGTCVYRLDLAAPNIISVEIVG